jgi:hypothetical protein
MLETRPGWKFKLGDIVYKHTGSWWCGQVVGFYSTKQTSRGYAVQMQLPLENGPVQIYPEHMLILEKLENIEGELS